jgi:hypothetical protein
VRSWLESVGTICGDTIYSSREAAALKAIESYILDWQSSQAGVVMEILKVILAKK